MTAMPAGIGKSRLASAAAELADPSGAVPLLAPVLGIGGEAGYEPVPAEGQKLYELIDDAVEAYLVACLGHARRACLAPKSALVRSTTIQVLGSLLEKSQRRLLVVITGRPGAWLPECWPVKVLDLAALTDEQTDELITALDPSLSAQDRTAVADRCDGVPFYIEQVVTAISEVGVPEALYEPLFSRLRASANVVPVVEAAAVIGRHIDRALLCPVVDLSDDELDDVIDELEDARVLDPWGTDRRMAIPPRAAARGGRRIGPAERPPGAPRQGGRRADGRRRPGLAVGRRAL